MHILSLSYLFYSLLFVYREYINNCDGNRNRTISRITRHFVGVYGSSDSSTMSKIVFNQTILQNHTLGCTENEIKTLSCLNGGSCFVVYIDDRTVQCACYTQYIGYRCEMIDRNITLKSSESTEEKDIENRHIPGITAGVVAVFIVVLAIILIRRIERKSSEGNGSETTNMV